tara:strand:- start:417 stop:614 length:198 start_codon:yes stop_codon:yes gene_type:complete
MSILIAGSKGQIGKDLFKYFKNKSNVLALRKLVKIFNLQKKKSLFVNLSTIRVSKLKFINCIKKL